MRQSSQRYAQGFEDAAIGMAILTRDLVVVRANEALCELLGRPAAQVVGRSIIEFTHPDDRVRSLAKGEAIVHGDEEPIVKRYVRADGSSGSAARSACASSPRASRTATSSPACATSAASSARATCSRGRCRRRRCAGSSQTYTRSATRPESVEAGTGIEGRTECRRGRPAR